MNTYFSKIFKIKSGKEQVFFNWMNEINERKDEAIETFEYEGVHREMFVIFESADGTYVLGLNEAPDVPKRSDRNVEMNRKHVEVMRECLEPISERGTIILDLSRKVS